MEPPSTVFEPYLHSVEMFESITICIAIILHFHQRGTGAIPLEQKVMKNFFRLSLETDLQTTVRVKENVFVLLFVPCANLKVL